MNKRSVILLIPISLLVLVCLFLSGIGIDRAVSAWSESRPPERSCRIIIDAGHGGEDGGATSCTGILESTFNLDISLRLNDLLHLLGYETVMIRTDDRSVYTQGDTIAAKKVSDLKQRVKIINETPNAILISIHQNHFADARYSGAQVFYAKTQQSNELAVNMQNAFRNTINPGSNRKVKKADNIYIMQHITCPGVLIECGFLSNPQEEHLLRTPEYQKKLCCVITTQISQFTSKNQTET